MNAFDEQNYPIQYLMCAFDEKHSLFDEGKLHRKKTKHP
jgi:hypothetical protein